MKLWLICGMSASLCWGSYVIVNKIVTSPKHFGMSSSTSALFMGVGALITFALYFVFAEGSVKNYSAGSCMIALLPGVIWSLGMIAVLFAVSKDAPVSKLALVYNTNTFVAVFLGAVVLSEIPRGSELIRVIIGAILVTAGVIIAGWK